MNLKSIITTALTVAATLGTTAVAGPGAGAVVASTSAADSCAG